ncbi:MAG: KH domain-containing protein [Anaerolineae bacterium]
MAMKELVAYLAKNLVNDPSQVKVREKVGRQSVVLELQVAPDDMGRVIGKGGRVATAMRTLLRVAAVRQGKRVTLNIVEPRERESASQ